MKIKTTKARIDEFTAYTNKLVLYQNRILCLDSFTYIHEMSKGGWFSKPKPEYYITSFKLISYNHADKFVGSYLENDIRFWIRNSVDVVDFRKGRENWDRFKLELDAMGFKIIEKEKK